MKDERGRMTCGTAETPRPPRKAQESFTAEDTKDAKGQRSERALSDGHIGLASW